MSTVTGSDHRAVTVSLELNHMLAKNNQVTVKRNNYQQTVFLYEEAKEENWQNYQQEIDRMLKNQEKKLRTLEEQIRSGKEKENNSIDQLWEIIRKIIVEGAYKHIPKKKIRNTKAERRKSKPKSSSYEGVIKIGKWIRKAKQEIGEDIEEAEQERYKKEVRKINRINRTKIRERVTR
jgi:PHD/YefM family antitoxin component YafN of YafNO toxin-antitoxin module